MKVGGLPRDVGLISGWGRAPGEGNGNPLQYSYQDNPIDRGAWRARVHGVPKLLRCIQETNISTFIPLHAPSLSCVNSATSLTVVHQASLVNGISQARILERVVIHFSRRSS